MQFTPSHIFKRLMASVIHKSFKANFPKPRLDVQVAPSNEPGCLPKQAPLARIYSLSSRGQALTSTSDALFWDTIISTDVTPADNLPNIVTIVYSPTKINVARSLRGDQAQSFIDLLDRVSGQSKLTSGFLVLIIGRFSPRYPISIRKYSGGAHNCSIRSAKLTGRFPPHILSNQTSPTLVSSSGRAALQT